MLPHSLGAMCRAHSPNDVFYGPNSPIHHLVVGEMRLTLECPPSWRSRSTHPGSSSHVEPMCAFVCRRTVYAGLTHATATGRVRCWERCAGRWSSGGPGGPRVHLAARQTASVWVVWDGWGWGLWPLSRLFWVGRAGRLPRPRPRLHPNDPAPGCTCLQVQNCKTENKNKLTSFPSFVPQCDFGRLTHGVPELRWDPNSPAWPCAGRRGPSWRTYATRSVGMRAIPLVFTPSRRTKLCSMGGC